MKIASIIQRRLSVVIALALLASLGLNQEAFAKFGATDPIPGTSKGAVKSGGGKSSTPAPTPAPTPATAPATGAIVPLTFSASGPVNGVLPVCTGSYHVDPYYPTLSLMTVDVQTSSLNVADGTYLYVSIVGTGGTLYPFTSNLILVAGQSGSCSHSAYITPGTTVTGIIISDVSGNIVFAGN